MNTLAILSPEQIREYVLENYTTKNNHTIAIELGIGIMSVANAYSKLVQRELVPRLNDKVIIPIDKKIKKIESDMVFKAYINKENNTYSNSDGAKKSECRDKITNRIIGSGLKGTILSLPYFTCELERKILALTNAYSFVGVEHTKSTFDAMKQVIRQLKLPIQPYFGSVSDMIYGFDTETYAHAILDYCGFLPTYKKELIYFFSQKLVPIGGTVHVTMSTNVRARGDNYDDYKALASTIHNCKNDNRNNSEVEIRSWFDKATGFDYHVEEIFFYRDLNPQTNKLKSPMCLVQLTRIK